MDIEVILDAAQAVAPGLREVARRLPEAETRHRGVPLDAASVMVRRSEGVPRRAHHRGGQPTARAPGGHRA